MKKVADLENAKQLVQRLLGKNVVVKLNRGRNRVKSYRGVVCEVHPNVFIVSLCEEIFDRISCSYADILCGEVKISEA